MLTARDEVSPMPSAVAAASQSAVDTTGVVHKPLVFSEYDEEPDEEEDGEADNE